MRPWHGSDAGTAFACFGGLSARPRHAWAARTFPIRPSCCLVLVLSSNPLVSNRPAALPASAALLDASSAATTSATPVLLAQPLTAQAFAPFGEVIDVRSSGQRIAINAGSSLRHHDLARPSAQAPGQLALSLFDAQAAPAPWPVRLLERHRLGSQAFTPFGSALRMLVVVAPAHLAAHELQAQHLQAFISNGQQGINLRAGVWHHPLISLDAGPWLVVDRVSDDPAETVDCEVQPLRHWGLQLHMPSSDEPA